MFPPPDREWARFVREYVEGKIARAVEDLVKTGLHPVKARRLVKDVAIVAAAEGGPEMVGHRLAILVLEHTNPGIMQAYREAWSWLQP